MQSVRAVDRSTSPASSASPSRDLLCFSHLRWDWVFQRPQHLLTRAARNYRVHVFEEPERVDGPDHLHVRSVASGVSIVTPQLGDNGGTETGRLRQLLDLYIAQHCHALEVLWYYTPMALPFSDHLSAPQCVYDCMDELSAFAGAPRELQMLEQRLMHRADVVFTGGLSLYDRKSAVHGNCHAVPSSVDTEHFRRARSAAPCNLQLHIARPRVGFAGVVDERMDLSLVEQVAARLPDVQFVFVGPVCKIDPDSLPSGPNIHWLGGQPYDALPTIMGSWDIAWMPFALNEATRYISPTKTPEYLAAGLPVISTRVRDVVRMWESSGLVALIETVDECVDAVMLTLKGKHDMRLARIDNALRPLSWDNTWARMHVQLEALAEDVA